LALPSAGHVVSYMRAVGSWVFAVAVPGAAIASGARCSAGAARA